MKYHNILHDDMRNGEGLRVVLFVSGCDHKCHNCQNPQTWNSNDGIDFTTNEMLELKEQLSKDYISGLTLSGGDPLYIKNRDEIYCLCQWVKKLFPNKTIWMYTGYRYEDVKDLQVMDYVDVLVDGKFDQKQADISYYWAGSRNQRIIDVKKSIKNGNTELYADEVIQNEQ